MKTITSLILSMALIFVSCEIENQPTQTTSDSETQSLSKKGGKPKAELITFDGNLTGSQEVVGCCPNAGPFPEYTMTLSDKFPVGFRGEHAGNIFMNAFGRKLPWDYKVQFWWGGEPGNNYFIEINGGVLQRDKRTKITTVTFTNEQMTIWYPDNTSDFVDVSFTIRRVPIR
jgi:hypothetical protein